MRPYPQAKAGNCTGLDWFCTGLRRLSTMADARPTLGGGRSELAPIVDAAALQEMLSSASPPAVLDVRWKLGGPPGHEIYLAGHLPGACYVDLDADLADPPGSGAGGRHPLPSAGRFESAMRRAGLRSGQLAVAYDDG